LFYFILNEKKTIGEYLSLREINSRRMLIIASFGALLLYDIKSR
jgi:hypothetical protein